MKIKIIQKPDDGNFKVGEIYNVQMQSRMFVYAFDEDGDIECVYNYQYKWVE